MNNKELQCGFTVKVDNGTTEIMSHGVDVRYCWVLVKRAPQALQSALRFAWSFPLVVLMAVSAKRVVLRGRV